MIGILYFCREFKVTVIMRRYTHDRAGTVVRKYIVCKIDWDLLSVDRVDRIGACEHTGLFLAL